MDSNKLQKQFLFLARNAPFTVTVKMDDQEVATGTTAQTNEQTTSPSGLVGFQLNFAQQTAACV